MYPDTHFPGGVSGCNWKTMQDFLKHSVKKDVSYKKTVKIFKNREEWCLGTFSSSQNGHKMSSMGSQGVFLVAFCIKKSDLID